MSNTGLKIDKIITEKSTQDRGFHIMAPSQSMRDKISNYIVTYLKIPAVKTVGRVGHLRLFVLFLPDFSETDLNNARELIAASILVLEKEKDWVIHQLGRPDRELWIEIASNLNLTRVETDEQDIPKNAWLSGKPDIVVQAERLDRYVLLDLQEAENISCHLRRALYLWLRYEVRATLGKNVSTVIELRSESPDLFVDEFHGAQIAHNDIMAWADAPHSMSKLMAEYVNSALEAMGILTRLQRTYNEKCANVGLALRKAENIILEIDDETLPIERLSEIHSSSVAHRILLTFYHSEMKDIWIEINTQLSLIRRLNEKARPLWEARRSIAVDSQD